MAVCAAAASLQNPDWLKFLRAACAVAEGATVLGVGKRRFVSAAAACVLAVLGDPLGRIAVLGGREGMPRSLGSAYGGFVTRFLSGFRGVPKRTIVMSGVYTARGLAVSRDGSMLLVADTWGGSHALHVYSVHTGVFLRSVGGYGSGPLQFDSPSQVCVASDGVVLVADCYNGRIQVLTAQLAFIGFVGDHELYHPTGVCANDDVVVASESVMHRISVFNRRDGRCIHRFGSHGDGDAQFTYPERVCLMSGHRRIAVLDHDNDRASVWTLEGEFVRHVGVGKLIRPSAIACSDADELVVSDWPNNRACRVQIWPNKRACRVQIFGASGDLIQTLDGDFHSAAMCGGTIVAQCLNNNCVVFS